MLGITMNDTVKNDSYKVLNALSQLCDLDSLFIAVNDTKTNHIINVVNRHEVIVTESNGPFSETYCSRVCTQEVNILTIPNTHKDPLTKDMKISKALGAVSFIGAPIRLQNGTKVGTICGIHRPDYTFTPKEVELFQTFSEFVGYVIDLQRSVYIDELTGAYTRKYLSETFDSWKTTYPRLSLLYFDFNDFKLLNDNLGHQFGDHVLHAISHRIQSVFTDPDRGLLFRLGGDEFGLLTPEPYSVKELVHLGNKLLAECKKPLSIDDRTVEVTPSIGIASYPMTSGDLPQMLRHADIAMYAAKRDGSGVRLFEIAEEEALQERLQLREGLRSALELNRLQLHFQPLVNIETGSIVCVEALLRWRDDDGKSVPPDKFIPVAEETGLIGPIGQWVFRQACLQRVEWTRQGIPPFVVSINVSPKQFEVGRMYQAIQQIVNETGVDPRHIGIEITEGFLVKRTDELLKELGKIRELGIILAVDDFGTGYSSLAYLKLMNPTHLKIDRTFVNDMLLSTDDMSIVTSVIELAHGMGIRVVAEGVETDEQLLCLSEKGCDLAQGYLISHPLPASELRDVLQSGQIVSYRIA